MNYSTATTILQLQDRNLRKLNNFRFTAHGVEYRLKYESGFAPMLWIEWRLVGKRNFKEYNGLSMARCMSIKEAFEMVLEHIGEPKNTELLDLIK